MLMYKIGKKFFQKLQKSNNTYLTLRRKKIDKILKQKEIAVKGDIDDDICSETYNLYLKNIKKYRLLRPQEEKKILKEISEGNMLAKEKLINANLRLVISIAKKYSFTRIEFMDLIQTGNIGLIEAIDNFDYSKGERFSTYATFWIIKEINALTQEEYGLISIPNSQKKNIKKFRKAQYELYKESMVMPTDEELACKMNISLKKVKTIRSYIYEFVSLYKEIDDETRVEDFIQDDKVTEEIAIRSICKDDLKNLIEDSGLNEREMRIFKMRYDIENDQFNTLEYIASKSNMVREAVRLNINKSLVKIKNNLKKEKNKDIMLFWN